jgi:hypothetical protein
MSVAHRGQGSSVALLERLVLASFASPAGLTRRELEELTGLSRTVVAGVVASLVTRAELAETLQPATGGGRGRPPTRYQRTALLPPILLIQLRKDRSTSVSSLDLFSAAGCSPARTASLGSWPTYKSIRRGPRAPAGTAAASAPKLPLWACGATWRPGTWRSSGRSWAARSHRWSPCSTRTAWWSTPGLAKAPDRSSPESPRN